MTRAAGPLHDRMLFAFGVRRSGTYWLQRVLCAHPQIAEVPSETALFSDGIKPLFERFHHGLRSSTVVGKTFADREVLLDATRAFCDAVLAPYMSPGARYLCERSPMHVEAVDVIADVYPDARLVHIVRDGRDVTRSLLARAWGPGNVAAAATQWRDGITAARAAAPVDRYREIRYEDLLADPEREIAALYGWLGLAADEQALAPALVAVRTPRNEDASDPRLAHGKWRDHFSAADLDEFMAVGGDLLAQLGYDATLAPAAAGASVALPTPGDRPAVSSLRARAGAALKPLRRSRTAAGGGEGGPAPVAGAMSEVGGPLAGVQATVDEFFAAIHTGRLAALTERFHPAVEARLISAAGEQVATGVQAVVDLLGADAVWRGRQLRGDFHPGIPGYSAILTYELADGTRTDRIVALSLRGARIARVAVYEPPLDSSHAGSQQR